MELFHKAIKKYNGLSIVLKATFWFTVCSFIQKSISMLTTPIFTRLLTTEEYGLYSTYLSWLNIFTVCISLKLEAGVFNKGMSKFKEDRDGYTTSMQGLTTLLTTVMLGIYLIFYKSFNNMTSLPTVVMLAMFAELYFVPAYNFWIRRMRYDYKYQSVIGVTLAIAISNAVVGIIFVLMSSNDRGVARIYSLAVVQVFYGLFIYIYNLRKSSKLIHWGYWKYAVSFNIPLLPHYFSMYILQHSDRIMIQKICGYSDVAKYSVVYSFSMVLNTVTDSINHAVIPWLYRELEEKKFDNMKKKVNILLSFVSIMLLCFMIFAPEVMRVLAPERYYRAVYLIPPVAASILFIFIYTLLGNVEFYYNYNKLTMYVSTVGALLNIILNLIFIRIYGYVAAAYTTLVCYFVFALTHYIFASWIVRQKENLELFDRRFLAILSIGFVTVSILLSFTYPYIILRYSIVCILLIIVILKRRLVLSQIRHFM